MEHSQDEIAFSALCDRQNYLIDSLETEIRADRHTQQLLKQFHRWLLESKSLEPLTAGLLAGGADYFLRDFLIGAQRRNIFEARAEQLRQFGGNWYIISNLEPNLAELAPMLDGAAHFYHYCAEKNLYPVEEAEQMATLAADRAYYQSRIDSFHQLEGNGYKTWDQECPQR